MLVSEWENALSGAVRSTRCSRANATTFNFSSALIASSKLSSRSYSKLPRPLHRGSTLRYRSEHLRFLHKAACVSATVPQIPHADFRFAAKADLLFATLAQKAFLHLRPARRFGRTGA